MAQGMISCPLCSAPSFSNTNSLCFNLVNITSKKLRCILCEEELNGLDKFTLHLLSHLIQNTDFKGFPANDGMPTTSSPCIDTNELPNSEPLNLVKDSTSNQPVIHQSEKTLISDKLISNFEKKTNEVVSSERPSLKVDNEVMIFFNPNEHLDNSCEETRKMLEGSLNPLGTNAPLSTLNTEQCTEVQKSLCSESETNSSVFISNNSTVLLPEARVNLYHSPDKLSNTTDIRTSELPTKLQPEFDITSLNRHENVKKRPLDSSDILQSCGNEPEAQGLRNKPCIKSSFLSPKGERVLGFRCDICSLVFPDEHIMLMHRQLIHIEISGDPLKTNRFKCHLCSKSFVMRGSLMVHMRVAHFGGAVVARLVESKQLETNVVSPESAHYTCSVCNKGFKKEYQLTQHEKLHDGKQCDICLKTFTTKYFLRKHKRLHTGEMPYTCNICNKSFTFQQSYHKHLLYHSDEKPYSCAECGRAFKELSTLHNHQRIHTGEKPFSCETCGKCFRQRVSYLVHRRIHTGIMPYKCQECGKTFRYKVSERTHKCALSNAGPTADSVETTVSEGTQDSVCVNVLSEATAETEHLAEDQVMNDGYPEPPDFFSLVMSPVDRLQHLSLSGEETDTSADQQAIDSEALKQLLYDVADYT